MADGRPKPLSLVKGHRTKAEKAIREQAEKQLVSGTSFREWDEVKNNVVAHKEFVRLKKVFKAIKKDDALHESIINRYCLIHAECKKFESMVNLIYEELKEVGEAYHSSKLDFMTYLNEKNKLQDKLMQCDKKIMDKRKMMLDIEKENIMTIASVLRSIPKKPQENTEIDPISSFLSKRG